jgi:hypothetical protein
MLVHGGAKKPLPRVCRIRTSRRCARSSGRTHHLLCSSFSATFAAVAGTTGRAEVGKAVISTPVQGYHMVHGVCCSSALGPTNGAAWMIGQDELAVGEVLTRLVGGGVALGHTPQGTGYRGCGSYFCCNRRRVRFQHHTAPLIPTYPGHTPRAVPGYRRHVIC